MISFLGILYFCAVDARLYAVEIGTPLASSPWPMHGRDRLHIFRAQLAGTLSRDPQFHPIRGFQTILTGLSSGRTNLQYSTDLVLWQTLTNLPMGAASLLVRDPNPGKSAVRFCRAVQ